MQHRVLLLAVLSILGLTFASSRLEAGPLRDARIALHAQPRARKFQCTPSGDGGVAPTEIPCSRFRTELKVGEPYSVYLVVARIPPSAGLAGIGCSIDYDPRPGKGVDIWEWVHCGDAEIGGVGAGGVWPAAGAGNLVIWNISEHCQRRRVPGYADQGAQAVVGALYCYAYGPDVLTITRPEREDASFHLALVDCSVGEVELQDFAAGSIAFSVDGRAPGCNPCLSSCAPKPVCEVEPERIDFGNVLLGESKDRPLRVRNLGPGNLRLRAQAPCLEFTITTSPNIQVLAPGEETRVVVRYTPFLIGDAGCVADVGSVCTDVELTGTGVWPEPRKSGPTQGLLAIGGDPTDPRRSATVTLPAPGPIRLDLFDVAGRRVRVLADTWGGAGVHRLEWDAGDLPAGVYFLRLRTGAGTASARLVRTR